MSKLDYLMSTMNLKSTQVDSLPGGGQPELTANDVAGALGMRSNRGIKISPEAMAIGFAIHLNDEQSKTNAQKLAVVAVKRIFDEERWSAQKPFQQSVNNLVKTGQLPQELAASEKEQRGKQLIVRMAMLALDEVLSAGQPCKRCKGQGKHPTADKTSCRSCKGKGFHVKHELVDDHRLLRWDFFPGYMDVPVERSTKVSCSKCHQGEVLVSQPCTSCSGTGRTGFTDKLRSDRCDIGYESWKKTWRHRYQIVLWALINWQNEYEAHAVEKC